MINFSARLLNGLLIAVLMLSFSGGGHSVEDILERVAYLAWAIVNLIALFKIEHKFMDYWPFVFFKRLALQERKKYQSLRRIDS